MKTLLALFLAGACGAVSAQTPATNPMPDGSFDSYVGLGVVSAAAYPGAADRQVKLRPLLQFETSGGLFVSGMSAGLHLSQQPGLEFGPLLALDPGRDASGINGGAGGVTDPVAGFGVRPSLPISPVTRVAGPGFGLNGLHDVRRRLQGGVFANYYLSADVRLTGTLLYGAGNDHDGLVGTIGIQRMAVEFAPHHKVTVSAGVTLVNASHNASYFGVSKDEAGVTGYSAYAPRSGVRDVYVGAGWNWALSPSWMVTSAARLSVLTGDARHSPLTERPTNFTVTTGLAYRF